MAIYIYILRHPETRQIHYVGKTNCLGARRKGHEQAGGRPMRVREWVKSLREAGMRPTIEAIETVSPASDWQNRERYWIAYYKALGCDLLNVSAGGGANSRHSFSAEMREKMRQRFKGRRIPPEQRAQISKSLTGKKQSPETAAKRRATINANRAAKGLPPWNFGRDEATRNKRAREAYRERATKHGTLVMGSPEWKDKIRQSLLKRNATLTPEQRRKLVAHMHDPSKPRIAKKRGPLSEEHKQQIRESVKRTKMLQAAVLTPEERRRMAAHLHDPNNPLIRKKPTGPFPARGPRPEATKQKIRESLIRMNARKKQAG
jgi:hypothetical protein